MGAREWIFVAVAVLAVYLVFQLIRALQVKDAPEMDATDDAADEAAADDDEGEDDEDDEDDGDAQTQLPAASASGASLSAAPIDESFGLALEIRQLRRDVAQLRDDFDAQRAEIAQLRDTLDGQAQQIEAARAAQRVSPIYGEALSLAQRGMAAEVIAERCSISVAEAELVQSLAQESASSGEAS